MGNEAGCSLFGDYCYWDGGPYCYNDGADSKYCTDSDLTSYCLAGDIKADACYAGYLQDASNNSFINATYTKEYVKNGAVSYLNRLWWYQAFSNFTNGSINANQNISIYNTTGFIQNLTTNSLGFTSIIELLEYINNGTKNYVGNYTFNSTYGTETISHKYNLTLSQNIINDVFTFTISSACWLYDSVNHLLSFPSSCDVSPLYLNGRIVI